jgi:hypothetical protein
MTVEHSRQVRFVETCRDYHKIGYIERKKYISGMGETVPGLRNVDISEVKHEYLK